MKERVAKLKEGLCGRLPCRSKARHNRCLNLQATGTRGIAPLTDSNYSLRQMRPPPPPLPLAGTRDEPLRPSVWEANPSLPRCTAWLRQSASHSWTLLACFRLEIVGSVDKGFICAFTECWVKTIFFAPPSPPPPPAQSPVFIAFFTLIPGSCLWGGRLFEYACLIEWIRYSPMRLWSLNYNCLE